MRFPACALPVSWLTCDSRQICFMETFVPLRSFVLGPSFLPIPSALVTFRSPAGAPQVLCVGWVGLVCTRPALLSVSIRFEGDEPPAVREGEPFAVNLPGEELLQALINPVGPDREELAAHPSLSFSIGGETGVPLIAECPVQIECRCRTADLFFGQKRLCGEIVAVHVDGVRHEPAAPVDVCRLNPFHRRHFHGRRGGPFAATPLDKEGPPAGELK